MQQAWSSSAGPKLLLYSHDTVGLGNVRRTLLLAEELAREVPEASILIVTGSPVVHGLPIPSNTDYVKLPALDRYGPGAYRARSLLSRTAEVKRARRDILTATVKSFDPDMVIVDKYAAGVGGEFLPALEHLRRRGRARVVLGMRDVLDEPQRTRAVLRRSDGFALMERCYREIWIYGSAAVFDSTKEYAFPDAVMEKTRFCGYLRFPRERRAHRIGAPGVLVTVGGGQDGSRVVRTYLEGLRAFTVPGSLCSLVVLGPHMPESGRKTLRRRYRGTPGVQFEDFRPRMGSLFAASDVVVGMAGYGTVCELLSQRGRGVLVPRAEPVCEQTIRARRLAQLGLFRMIEWKDLSPERLVEALFAALDAPRPRVDGVDLDGLHVVRRRARLLLAEAAR